MIFLKQFKKITYFLIVLIFFILLPSNISAHGIGEPPYFKVNGVLADYYTVPPLPYEIMLDIAQDIAPENYLANEPIEFEIDTSLLTIPPEVVKDIKFTWDYGDGSQAEGVKNTHTYTKPGSYVLKIYAQYKNDQPQKFQSIFLNVLPNLEYKLPTAAISVNGKLKSEVSDSTFLVDFNKEITLEAIPNDSSSEIVEYMWDFGNGEVKKGKKITYKLKHDSIYSFPVLRIISNDGYIFDDFVYLRNEQQAPSNPAGDLKILGQVTGYGFLVIIPIIVIVGILGYVFRKKAIKSSKK